MTKTPAGGIPVGMAAFKGEKVAVAFGVLMHIFVRGKEPRF